MQGYHSHASANQMEWFLFNEGQACPIYVVTLRAIQDTRTHMDDEAEEKITIPVPKHYHQAHEWHS